MRMYENGRCVSQADLPKLILSQPECPVPQAISALRNAHVGTAAPGCPVERSSTRFDTGIHLGGQASGLRPDGQPGAAVPTWAFARSGMATPEGVEPPSLRSDVCCSIQLSYGAAMRSPWNRSATPGRNSAAASRHLQIPKLGVGNGNRTRNRRSHSPVLCQLSYSHHRLDYSNSWPDCSRDHPQPGCSRGSKRKELVLAGN